MSGLPGPDGDKGGKFLLVPPDYTGDIPESGYHLVRAPLHNYNVMVRGILRGGMDNAPETVRTVKQLRVYPWSERTNPKATKFISISGVEIDTLPPHGLEFWSRLSAFINNNPVQERDLFYMGMLRPLGIEKGKPFDPDARQRAILEEAARIGDAMGRVMLFDGPERFSKPHPFPGTKWHWVFQVNPVQQTDTYGQIDERLHYTYGAIYTAPALGIMKAGPGGNYAQTFKDKDGQRFEGGKNYRLHVPANVPAAAFWSLTVYDSATRSMSRVRAATRPTRRTTTSNRTPTARSTCTSGRAPPQAWRTTGSRPFPARAGIRCFASTPRKRDCSTGRGSCRMSS